MHRWISPSIVIWAMLQGRAVFNIEVCKTCQIPFWSSKKIFFEAFYKNVLYKVSTGHSEGFYRNCMLQNTMPVIYK